MPKVRSQRSISRAHTTSVKPVDRAFAVQDNAVHHVDVGALKDVPADEILHSVNADDASHPLHAPNKKERRILKHELFIERLEASRAPYSKSHARRLKRREKEQLTGRLWSLKAALPSIAPKPATTATTRTAAATAVGESSSADKEVDAAATTTCPTTSTTTTVITAATAARSGVSVKPITKPSITSDPVEAPPPPPTRRPGQIGGEGHGAPLTKSQRRRALKAERFRQPLIRSNPEFAASPFETIRTHARNTLVPHTPTT
ncbi:ribosome biogenesis protein SLX9-domain-containing protein [Russula vinacea]|nr:ribosome biogenesis protein SLX9-domain-containing protein [Russula vinacea]